MGPIVKHQSLWLEIAYEALTKKRKSNLQLGVGAIFRYDQCPVVRSPDILNHVAEVWLGCKPLIETMIT